MKRRLILFVAVVLGLSVELSPANVNAASSECYFETYGSGQCGLTCVDRNDQGSVTGWETWLYRC
jgi:hypothetical protein